jgi:hypothetical protein
MGRRRRSSLSAAAAGATLVGCSLIVDTTGLSTVTAQTTDIVIEGGAPDAAPDVAPDVSQGGFGLPTTIATTLAHPSYVAADRDRVYVLTDSAALSLAATGEGAPTILASSLNMPLGLAAGSSNIFFANGELGYTHVYSVPKAGGPAGKLFSNSAGENRIPFVSAEGRSLAFLDLIIGGSRDIVRGNDDGASWFTVAEGQAGTSAVVLRAPYVYWATPSGILRSNGAAPQAPELFATDAAGVTELVADDTTLYWCPSDGKLRALRFDRPATAPVILESGLRAPQGLAVDAVDVYWASSVTGEVRAIPKAGGASTIIAAAQPDPWAVAANDMAVFFTNRSAGTVLRVPKL